jgi:hypothetical protein
VTQLKARTNVVKHVGRHEAKPLRFILVMLLGLAAGVANNSGAQTTNALPAQATFTLPPANSGSPFGSTSIDLPSKGYVEQEFLVSGIANRYRIKDPLKTAEIVDGGHPYMTRILVRRPKTLANFNGIVLVEWYNVTGQQDLDFVFGATRNHLLEQGYAWVGVSAQIAGVNALRARNPARYANLSLAASNVDPAGGTLDVDFHCVPCGPVPGDVLSWDIYTQIGKVLRTPGPLDPLGGLKPKLVIATGESQSAARLSKYYNSILPLYPDVFDGFLLYDRLQGVLRTDIKTKLLSFGSEATRTMQGAAPPDAANFRAWEVAGASHLSLDEMRSYMDDQVLRNGITRHTDGTPSNLTDVFVGCANSPVYSRVSNGDVLSAGLEALITWVKRGKAPSVAPRMGADAQGKLARDSEGRVSGGIRLAAYDAPIAVNLGANSGPGFCVIAGSHQDFSPAELCHRYGSPQNYVARVTEVTRKARSEGFLLKPDADRTIREARSVSFVCH